MTEAEFMKLLDVAKQTIRHLTHPDSKMVRHEDVFTVGVLLLAELSIIQKCTPEEMLADVVYNMPLVVDILRTSRVAHASAVTVCSAGEPSQN